MPGLNARALLAKIGRAALAVLFLTACVTAEETPEAPPPPDQIVAAFLAAASGGEPDRGWPLLHPSTQAEMFANDFEAYLELANSGSWDSFSWTITDVVADDPSLHFVYLQLDSTTLPPLLADARNHLYLLGALDPRNPVHLDVRYDAAGVGIWAKGG
jgi:hypothetical protein